ncbi:malonic semialdehyde reductase [Pyxidicoccus parkwayensis]|uniref:Putative NADH dehydrogenase/NAD(P)H nitroreductase JY651_22430 n=1 Tax=Pyxidicoccus parkwayensis TaxID=2813578 RepID=A0ABX7PAM0_9BACT|nr:malonic semialdehyde reductase [Pyxidicoccus parkwaysis]QSQ27500.1 malonic semialdehyde reductase [Pyxidicoccus parkwaysis]
MSSPSNRPSLDDTALGLLFSEARTHGAWLDRPVEPALLRRVYELTKMGPTSANTSPLRITFVTSAEAKARLLPAVYANNVEKVRTAPVTAVLAWDRTFWEKLPQLFPARPELREKLVGLPPPLQERFGHQSAYLSAGYFILAARAVGLDCGPLGGFDSAAVDAAFHPDKSWGSLLLCNLGYGDSTRLFPRLPRLAFDEACRVE